MFISEVLEVGIGLVFVYLAVSLACSGIYEAIAKLGDIRAKDLKKNLGELFGNQTLVDELYKHPFIKRITRKSWLDKKLGREGYPKEIDTGVIAAALTDKVGEKLSDGTVQTLKEAVEVFYKNLPAPKDGAGAKDEGGDLMQSMVNIVKLEAADLKDEIKRFQAEMETWIDESMSHVSHWFTRKARLIIVLVAVALCGVMNIDTIRITHALYNDNALRARVVAAADQLVEEGKEVKVAEQAAADPEKKGIFIEKQVEEIGAIAGDLKKDFQQLGLPIGWGFDKEVRHILGTLCVAEKKFEAAKEDKKLEAAFKKAQGEAGELIIAQTCLEYWLYKILGILITIAAVTMGAPFWHDILKKMMGFRKTLKGGKRK